MAYRMAIDFVGYSDVVAERFTADTPFGLTSWEIVHHGGTKVTDTATPKRSAFPFPAAKKFEHKRAWSKHSYLLRAVRVSVVKSFQAETSLSQKN